MPRIQLKLKRNKLGDARDIMSLNKVKTAGSQYLYGSPFSVLANDCSFLWQLEF